MNNPVCFVDCETTGLDPVYHSIWEVGLITPDGNEHVWQFPVNEMAADPFALNIGRYWDRRWDTGWSKPSELDAICNAHTPKARREKFPDQGRAIKPSATWARHFRDLTADCHLAGAVVSFDEERLRQLLHHNGVLHRWHYHLIDVEALAVGYLAGTSSTGEITLPWDSDYISAKLGIFPPAEDKHTALGDARWAKAVYDAVMLSKR